MTDTKVAAYARVREAVLTTSEPVRAICAREGVAWPAFYKYARSRGWGLRQSGRRRPEPKSLEGKLAAIAQTQLAALDGSGPHQPPTHLHAARLAAQTLGTLTRLVALERRSPWPSRAKRRVTTETRRMQLADRIDRMIRESEEKEARKPQADGEDAACTDELSSTK